MPYITKSFHFSAAHQYGRGEWSEKKNRDVFGDDIRLHGHNYSLEVTVKGAINPETGFVVNLGELTTLVKKRVIKILDHSTIEKDIPWFLGKQPSTENMVIWIWDQLEPELMTGKLHRIRLRETPTIYTDYYGKLTDAF